MPIFTLTNKAIADLKDIGRYTLVHWGREQRNLYLGMLDASFQQLASNPLTGKDCSDIRNGYRKFNAGSHVIFYRQQSGDTIEIVRILHGRMDCETRLSSP
jgi:toxin ParE1/3/4